LPLLRTLFQHCKDTLIVALASRDEVIQDSGNLVVANRRGRACGLQSHGDLGRISPISAPYKVFLLFDSSGSKRNDNNFLRSAVAKLIENLRPQDSLVIGSFDDNFKLNLPWSIDRVKATVKTVGPVQRSQRLGGMLNYYHRVAA